ncbi:WbqC family protein [Nitrosopumilus sp.]|uniref:WbqC family protein n=1 Tax=Nitrosopumilus sp. TaxID=2024843 RepID=UPI00263A2D63|nr:WbqC family protein [Nitrosopumilus sp.]
MKCIPSKFNIVEKNCHTLLKVVIHQPNYFPYSGFFHKLTLGDSLVLMDNTQYDKKFTNRNRIIVPNDWIWLSVPIKKEHKFSPNKTVEINNEIDWKKNHFTKIQKSYSNSKFFNLYKDYLKNLYEKEWNFLFELNYETITKVMEWLGIKLKIYKESDLNINGKSTERLVNICKSIGADTYISGIGGKEYMNEKLFNSNNINLEYQNFTHPIYEQHFSDSFIPNLSILDLLFNHGLKSLEILKNSQNNVEN